MSIKENSRIRTLLLEINFYRRLWQSWNLNGHLVKGPNDPKHPAVKYEFLLKHVLNSFFFIFVIRLFALMEEADNKFTFGYWLSTLKRTDQVRKIQLEYEEIIKVKSLRNFSKIDIIFLHITLKKQSQLSKHTMKFLKLVKHLKIFMTKLQLKVIFLVKTGKVCYQQTFVTIQIAKAVLKTT